MFEVLVFVYENYWHGEACPEPAFLERKLSAVGFDDEEIQEALTWLNELTLAANDQQSRPETQTSHNPKAPSKTDQVAQSTHSLRVYSNAEQDRLGAPCLGFVSFLESAGMLPMYVRELVLDRAMAAPASPLALDDFKIIILMVYWSLGLEPDALVLDELCDDGVSRVAH